MAAEVNVVLATAADGGDIIDNINNMSAGAIAVTLNGESNGEKAKENGALSNVSNATDGDVILTTEDEDDDEEDDDEEDDFMQNLVALRKLRKPNPDVPPTVTILTYQPHAAVPDQTAVIGKAYLVGTAHFSVESQNDVRTTIRETQPDIVMVELCHSRVAVLALDEATLLQEARNLTTEKMMKIVRESGFVQGIMHVLLLSMSAHITRQLGMAPGGEFRAAYQEAQKVPGCRWHLGDRPIQTTMARALATLSFWQKLRLFWCIMWSHNMSITKEEVEKCKQRDLLEELLREMAGEYPELSRIFVAERDLYMSHVLSALMRHAAAKRRDHIPADQPWEPVIVVAVVGIGHVPGIVANWGKVEPETVMELMKIPPPSRVSKCMKIAFKGTALGITAYIAYRGISYVYRLFVS